MGQGYGAANNFAVAAPAVSFDTVPTAEDAHLTCTTSWKITNSNSDVTEAISGSVSLGASLMDTLSLGASRTSSGTSNEYSTYGLLEMSCRSPMETGTGATFDETKVQACVTNPSAFSSTQGQCFISGMERASTLVVVITIKGTSSEQQATTQAKLEADVPAGGVESNNTFAQKLDTVLSDDSTTVEVYPFGLARDGYKFESVSKVSEIPEVITAFSASLQPQVVAVATTMYVGLDSRCVMDAACSSYINSEYRYTNTRLSDLIAVYSAAKSNPEEYSKAAWWIYIENKLTPFSDPGVHKAQVPTSDGPPKIPKWDWSVTLRKYQSAQARLSGWWLGWQNNHAIQAQFCRDGGTWESILEQQRFPKDELDADERGKPSNDCPSGSQIDSIDISDLSTEGRSDSDYYKMFKSNEALCCLGGNSDATVAAAIKCTFGFMDKGEECKCGI